VLEAAVVVAAAATIVPHVPHWPAGQYTQQALLLLPRGLVWCFGQVVQPKGHGDTP
jgi:hypothetical protein